MTIASLGTMGTGVSGTGSSSFTLTTITTALAAGDFAILVISSANASGAADGDNAEVSSVTGGTGTWSKLGEYGNNNAAAGGGVLTSVWIFYAEGANAVGTVFTINFSTSRANKCASMWAFSKAAGSMINISTEPATNPITSQVDAAVGFGSSAFSGLTSAERLYFRGLGKRANITTQLTVSTGFTAITADRSQNAAAARVVRGEFRINTSTGETSNPTQAQSGDTAGLFFALVEYTPPTVTTVRSPQRLPVQRGRR